MNKIATIDNRILAQKMFRYYDKDRSGYLDLD
jgi:Ca2+-binding EF-hand superfamily protein